MSFATASMLRSSTACVARRDLMVWCVSRKLVVSMVVISDESYVVTFLTY
jgi:hypothetical protein